MKSADVNVSVTDQNFTYIDDILSLTSLGDGKYLLLNEHYFDIYFINSQHYLYYFNIILL